MLGKQIIRYALALAAGLLLSAGSAAARTLGLVADLSTNRVSVIDADTDTVLGSVAIPSSFGLLLDVAISNNQQLGFVTDFGSHVWVIDLRVPTNPVLAAGTNPIPISNPGEDLSLTPDQRFLVVTDGGPGATPISVINIAARAEVSVLSTGTDNDSVDVCSNGSVLVGSNNAGIVRRFTINSAGTLTNTGEVLAASNPINVMCAPGGTSGIVINYGAGTMTSFTIPGLAAVNTRAIPTFGISGQVNAAGNRALVRSNQTPGGPGVGTLRAFTYNSTTGSLGAAALYSPPIADTIPAFGVDQLAVHPNDAKVYVSQPNAVNVYNAATGALLTTITNPAIVDPAGIALSPNFPDTFLVNYFAGANGARPDQTVRVTNTGSEVTAGNATADLCANIYVFRNDQQLAECCSCLVTPNGLRTLSVNFDLANNALTPGAIGEGVIKIVSSNTNGGATPCPLSNAGTTYTVASLLRAWGTHNQDVSGGLQGSAINQVTETHFLDATLSEAELRELQSNCGFIFSQGSGAGQCRCGRGD